MAQARGSFFDDGIELGEYKSPSADMKIAEALSNLSSDLSVSLLNCQKNIKKILSGDTEVKKTSVGGLFSSEPELPPADKINKEINKLATVTIPGLLKIAQSDSTQYSSSREAMKRCRDQMKGYIILKQQYPETFHDYYNQIEKIFAAVQDECDKFIYPARRTSSIVNVRKM